MPRKISMHPTGVQIDSVLTGVRGHIEAIALNYTRLFDRALRAQGVRTLLGTEEEMFIQPRRNKTFSDMAEARGEVVEEFAEGHGYKYISLEDSSASRAFAEEMQRAIGDVYAPVIAFENARRRANWERQKQIAGKQSLPPPAEPEWLIQSQIVERFEYTARGNPGRMEIINRPLSPATAAVCCAANIRTLYQMSKEGQKLPKADGIVSGKILQQLVKQGPRIHRVRFTPVAEGIAYLVMEDDDTIPRSYGTIYSQHWNISQHIPASSYGTDITEATPVKGLANLMTLPGYSEALEKMLQAFTDKDILVLMANPHSYSRLSRGRLQDDHHLDDLEDTAYIHQEGQMRSRVEFRVPDASSNPYLSALLVMGAAYYTATLLACLGGPPSLPFAERIVKGAALFEKYNNDVELTPEEARQCSEALLGTPLSPAHRNSEYIRDAYSRMLTSFRNHSLLLPMMREVGKERDVQEFEMAIERLARYNFLDPRKPSVAKKSHYAPLR